MIPVLFLLSQMKFNVEPLEVHQEK